jgi:hypothetical protein
MTTQTVVTRVAWNMMGCSDPVPLFKLLNPVPHLNNLTGDLMPQHQRCSGKTVPLHYIAATYSAGPNLHQKLARVDFGDGHLLQPNIVVVIIHSNTHSAYPPKAFSRIYETQTLFFAVDIDY